MNTKYLLAVGAIVTSLTLGACGNSNSESDHANHKDKQQEDCCNQRRWKTVC